MKKYAIFKNEIFGHFYVENIETGEILADDDGNILRFDTRKKAQKYIETLEH